MAHSVADPMVHILNVYSSFLRASWRIRHHTQQDSGRAVLQDSEFCISVVVRRRSDALKACECRKNHLDPDLETLAADKKCRVLQCDMTAYEIFSEGENA